MIRLFGYLAILLPLSLHSMEGAQGHSSVVWIASTAENPWQRMPDPVPDPSPGVPPQVRVEPGKTYQTIDGFGGCFNELGWIALRRASAGDREKVLQGLFGDEGCAFTLGRIPIGASDFATNAYSLDDTPGDLGLKDFSISRDRQSLLPYVKEAMRIRPELRCWGSAWSPPAWMKTNGAYSKGSLRWDPVVLESYACYLSRWVEAYRGEGIRLFALFAQNEPNIASDYPSCLWTGPQLRDFIGDYLAPVLKSRGTKVEIWLGTLNGDRATGGNNINDRLVTVLSDPKASECITGVSFQYDDSNLNGEASRLYPAKKYMASETECYDGKNDWSQAVRLFRKMKYHLESDASSYFAWNMILDDTGMSTWNWRQNALVTINRADGAVTFNPEYQVMRHFSRYLKPGAKRALTTGPWGDRIAFVNPDGSVVLVMGNDSRDVQNVVVNVAGTSGGTFWAKLPAHSFNTFLMTRR